jgi:hypothetical protein
MFDARDLTAIPSLRDAGPSDDCRPETHFVHGDASRSTLERQRRRPAACNSKAVGRPPTAPVEL